MWSITKEKSWVMFYTSFHFHTHWDQHQGSSDLLKNTLYNVFPCYEVTYVRTQTHIYLNFHQETWKYNKTLEIQKIAISMRKQGQSGEGLSCTQSFIEFNTWIMWLYYSICKITTSICKCALKEVKACGNLDEVARLLWLPRNAIYFYYNILYYVPRAIQPQDTGVWENIIVIIHLGHFIPRHTIMFHWRQSASIKGFYYHLFLILFWGLSKSSGRQHISLQNGF